MSDSADRSTGAARAALDRIRAHVAQSAPELTGDVEVVGSAIEQRDALKAAGDAMIYEISHPKRRGSQMMEALVAFRRVSEDLDR